MFKLTKEHLKRSAYYCAAGIDLQPILRFSDIVENFIYVSVGISKKEWLKGVEHSIKAINKESEENLINLISSNLIRLSDIEHNRQSKLISKPNYLNDNEFESYLRSFMPFVNDLESFNIELIFEVTIGSIRKEIRLIYLTGEALATYEVLYTQQEIAPLIFISIQTGSIENPKRFSNEMFESHTQKPKVWVRGFWSPTEFNCNYDYYQEVFEPYGIFNKIIAEFKNWDANYDFQIEGTTSETKPHRLVKAFGRKEDWYISPEDSLQIFKNDFICVRKLYGAYNGELRGMYSEGKYNMNFHDLVNKLNLGQGKKNYLDLVYKVYEYVASNYAYVDNYEVAIIPWGLESIEAYLRSFVDNFEPINNKRLSIDIYYLYPFDFKRNI